MALERGWETKKPLFEDYGEYSNHSHFPGTRTRRSTSKRPELYFGIVPFVTVSTAGEGLSYRKNKHKAKQCGYRHYLY